MKGTRSKRKQRDVHFSKNPDYQFTELLIALILLGLKDK